jgi:hypothetical protein
MKEFTVHAFFDTEARAWCGFNEELPLRSEADTLDHLLDTALAIAPEIGAENGLVSKGDR